MSHTKFFKPSLLALSIAGLAATGTAFAVFDNEGTEYTKAKQRFHLWNEALQPVEMVNSILCFTNQMRAEEFINDGPYMVLADENACFAENGGEDSQSSGSSNQPAYTKAIITSERENDTSPLIVSAWLPEMTGGDDEGGEQAIKFKAVISGGASDGDPFGQFTFNYGFYEDISYDNALGGGEVKTIDVDNKIGFTFFQDEDDFSQSASVVMNSDRSEGIALTSQSYQQGSAAFALAFNDNNMLLQKGQTYDELGFNNDNQVGLCFSRSDIMETVHRYDLYSATTGEMVELNSGFSFKYDSNSDSDNDSYGHIGYWGVWTEGDQELSSGTVITLETHGNGEQAAEAETYTVVSAPGKLVKKSLETLNLSEASGINFSYWSETAHQQGYNAWVVRYKTVAGDSVGSDGFYITHGQRWGENGEEQVAVTEELVSLEDNEILHLYSNQLGGQVRYKQGNSNFSFFKESFMTGSENATGELFAANSATLHCFDRCPIGELESSDLETWDGPFSTNPSTINDAIEYTISNVGSNPLTLMRSSNSEAVQYASGLSEESLQNTPNAWGIQSGAMVTAAVKAGMSNTWDTDDASVVTEFYIWETGPNNWNKMSTVKDSVGDYLTFDKPIQITYLHTDAKDRTGDAGDYDNQTFMLNYGGNGDLWGIPFVQDNDTGRHSSAFNLADGALLGFNDEYVVKAREIEGMMAQAEGQCSDLSIAEPEVPVPTSITGSANIGAMPTVTDAPKAIGGVLQSEEE
jgi:hypothetical protein